VTELLYLRDAYLREFDARVTAADGERVALDQTAFYPTGGGQPHDVGTLDDAPVVDVRKEGDVVWHTLSGPAPAVGASVHGVVDIEQFESFGALTVRPLAAGERVSLDLASLDEWGDEPSVREAGIPPSSERGRAARRRRRQERKA